MAIVTTLFLSAATAAVLREPTNIPCTSDDQCRHLLAIRPGDEDRDASCDEGVCVKAIFSPGVVAPNSLVWGEFCKTNGDCQSGLECLTMGNEKPKCMYKGRRLEEGGDELQDIPWDMDCLENDDCLEIDVSEFGLFSKVPMGGKCFTDFECEEGLECVKKSVLYPVCMPRSKTTGRRLSEGEDELQDFPNLECWDDEDCLEIGDNLICQEYDAPGERAGECRLRLLPDVPLKEFLEAEMEAAEFLAMLDDEAVQEVLECVGSLMRFGHVLSNSLRVCIARFEFDSSARSKVAGRRLAEGNPTFAHLPAPPMRASHAGAYARN